ncbi:MAG: glycosyltransferase [Hyphomonas sp.]|jgi:glycosyltransferase involved in cell wall biosynthesis|nr:glycosyltransferase [Hyphomonas sp.]
MMRPAPGDRERPVVFLDFSHLGRHVTGIERVTIELFEKVIFPGCDVRPVRATGTLGMIWAQQVLLPLTALFNPRARFVFPGFPPSPLFVLARDRVVHYVHDAFLMTRPQDLSAKARLYMAWPFRRAVMGLRHFLTNSEKTRAEIMPFVADDAAITLYRPKVHNVFGLDASQRTVAREPAAPIRIVSMGTVEPRKNYAAAVAILAALRDAGAPQAELHIVGRAGWGEDTERLKSATGVTLHGYLDTADVKALIENADLYLCTSHDEGLGLPLLEVQFAGIPVFAPDARVFREALGASGVFIDPARPDIAARTILDVVGDTAGRGEAARAALANLARWNAAADEDLARVRMLLAAPVEGSLTAVARGNA